MPEAYVTATRQFVAQSNGWALEELYLEAELVQPGNEKQAPTTGPGAFVVRGLHLLGAQCVNPTTIELSSTISIELPLAVLRWIR